MNIKKDVLSCAFDKLFTRSVPHILEKIFFSLDFDSFTACHEVSNSWYDLLSSESFRKIGRSMFQREIETIELDLFDGVRKGRIDEVRRLLSRKMMDVNYITDGNEGFTALHQAIRYRQMEIIKIIFEKGADVDKADKRGWTPLHYAAFWGLTNVVKLLLERGANPNKANDVGKTPLHFSKEVYAVLINGEDPHAVCYTGHVWCKRYIGEYHDVKTVVSDRDCIIL